MDKQDELVKAIRYALDVSEVSFYDLNAQEETVANLAAAVRSFMGSAKIESDAVEACRADPFCDDAALLGTTQQELRMVHYTRVALSAAIGEPEGALRNPDA